jgi:hypothetical protein
MFALCFLIVTGIEWESLFPPKGWLEDGQFDVITGKLGKH